jgi:hypothetical protein
MGFFKNIGKAIKKGAKQISFKNLVKVAGGLDPSGIISGIQDAHYLKKAGKEEEAQRLIDDQMQKAAVPMQSIASQITAQLASSAYAGVDDGLKRSAGVVGASVMDNAIVQWFKKHLKHIAMGVGGLIAVIILWKTLGNKPSRARGRR